MGMDEVIVLVSGLSMEIDQQVSGSRSVFHCHFGAALGFVSRGVPDGMEKIIAALALLLGLARHRNSDRIANTRGGDYLKHRFGRAVF